MLPSMSNIVRIAPTFDKSSPSRRLEAEGGADVAVEVPEASGVAAGRICRQAGSMQRVPMKRCAIKYVDG